jgi:hypothetical protein
MILPKVTSLRLSLVFHPTHLIEIIEAEDYNQFGFKKFIGQKSYQEMTAFRNLLSKFYGKETVCVDSVRFSCSYLRDQKLMRKRQNIRRKKLKPIEVLLLSEMTTD